MDVHHHAHTSRKKWTHYLWEFLMLFLAVFCGFLAENKREHYVEHQREKQFMRSMVEDLVRDTMELRSAISRADTTTRYADSVLKFLSTYVIEEQIPQNLALFVGKGGQRQNLINTDRTSSQLKNSGAMRLIRNKEVSDSILLYWHQIAVTAIDLDRYMIYRDASRSLVFKLWVIPEYYESSGLLKKDSIKFLRVIDPDRKKWDEFANLLAISGRILKASFIPNLYKQLTMARYLIGLIRRKYHLK